MSGTNIYADFDVAHVSDFEFSGWCGLRLISVCGSENWILSDCFDFAVFRELKERSEVVLSGNGILT